MSIGRVACRWCFPPWSSLSLSICSFNDNNSFKLQLLQEMDGPYAGTLKAADASQRKLRNTLLDLSHDSKFFHIFDFFCKTGGANFVRSNGLYGSGLLIVDSHCYQYMLGI